MTSERLVKLLNNEIICHIYKYLFRASPRTQCTSIGNNNIESRIGKKSLFCGNHKKSNKHVCVMWEKTEL